MQELVNKKPAAEERKVLEQRFEREEQSVRVGNYRRGAVLAALFASVGGFMMDLAVFGGVEHRDILMGLLQLRLACGFLLMGVLFILYHPASVRWLRLLGHLVALIPMLTLHWMLVVINEPDGSPYYAGLNLNMVGAVLVLGWRFEDGIINAVLCIGGYLAVALALGTEMDAIITHFFFLFVTAVFCCVGLYFFNKLRFREFCLRQEVLQQQSKLEASNVELQKLDEAKTRFFANISHELRTPLTLILAPVEKLKSSPVVVRDPAIAGLVDLMESNGFRLLRLINDLLDLVRLDSDQMRMRPERFRPAVFIDGLGRNLRPMAERNEVVLEWETNEEAEGELYLDRDRLEKIVLNLSVNALKFTPPGGRVLLSAKVEGGNLQLRVEDSGEGMTEEQVANAFERFWQADGSERRKHQGAGIGLALVKSLTESLDGIIGIESKVGKGTAFRITIPVVEVPLEVKLKEDGPPEAGAGKELDGFEVLNTSARLHGALAELPGVAGNTSPSLLPPSQELERVLIAEDETGLRKFLRGELEELGCEVIEASDGLQAWELLRQFHPDLAIFDLMMPEIDGITLTKMVREHDDVAQVPIVLVTARADDTPRIQALQAGVTDFLTKPFTTAELRVRIKNLLSGGRYQRELNVRNQELGDALAEIKENEARLLHAEKLSSLGRMSAGIVHEVNNPLNYAVTAMHALRMFSDDLPESEREDFAEILGDAEEGVGRVIKIISDLRGFTKGELNLGAEVNLAATVEASRRLVSQDLSGIDFTADVPDDLFVTGNENQLCQVFVNFIQNASQAVAAVEERGDAPKVSVVAEETPGGNILLRIRDNGCGINKEDIENIFDPFFTKRQVGEGMGLGLSICHTILKAHGARVEVDSEPGQFTEFAMHFQSARPSTELGEDPEGSLEPSAGGTPTMP